MWLSYHYITILHDNLAISYLRPLMSWYGKGEGNTPIYRTPWFIWCCHVSDVYTLLHFYSSLHLHPIIQIYFLYRVLHFTMKHDNYYSYLISTLLKPSYFGMILSSCIAKLVSCDFQNLLECSEYALHISTDDYGISMTFQLLEDKKT